MGAIILGENFIVRGQFSGGQLSSGAIVRGKIFQGAIIQGAIARGGAIFLGGNCPDTMINVLNEDQTLIKITRLEKVQCIEITQRCINGRSFTMTGGPLYISV